MLPHSTRNSVRTEDEAPQGTSVQTHLPGPELYAGQGCLCNSLAPIHTFWQSSHSGIRRPWPSLSQYPHRFGSSTSYPKSTGHREPPVTTEEWQLLRDIINGTLEAPGWTISLWETSNVCGPAVRMFWKMASSVSQAEAKNSLTKTQWCRMQPSNSSVVLIVSNAMATTRLLGTTLGSGVWALEMACLGAAPCTHAGPVTPAITEASVCFPTCKVGTWNNIAS